MQHKLYALRKENGVTQEEMAKSLEITTFTYRNKEKSKVPFNADEMYKLAEYFNKNIDDIFLPRN